MRKETQIINTALIAGLTLGAVGCERVSVPVETAIAAGSANTAEITPPVIPPIETISPDIVEVDPTSTPEPTVIPTEVAKSYEQFGLDLAKDGKVDVSFTLPSGTNLKMGTFKTLVCDWDTDTSLFKAGNHYACLYRLENDPNDMLVFTHSGWIGGILKLEAENIRHYIEDKSYDERQPIEVIHKLMNKFIGAKVEIKQGKTKGEELTVKAFVRIPPDKLGPFSHSNDGSLTNEDILDTMIAVDPSLAYLKNDGQPQTFIIFCGWKNPEENNLLGVPDSDANDIWGNTRYILVLGK